MRLFHTPTVASAIFDEPNLVSAAGLVPVMAAGADSIEDMGVLRHGAMGKVIGGGHAPSTLGSFLRAFTFGHYADPRIMPSWWRPVDVRPGQGRGGQR